MKNLLIIYSVLIVAFLFIPNAQAQSNTTLLISGPSQIAIGTGGGRGTWTFTLSSIPSQISSVKLSVTWGDGDGEIITSTVTAGGAIISLPHIYYTRTTQKIVVVVQSDDATGSIIALGSMPIRIIGTPIAPIIVSSFSVSTSTIPVFISPGESKIIEGIQFLNTVRTNPLLKIQSLSLSCDGCPDKRFDRLFSTLELYKRKYENNIVVDVKVGTVTLSSNKQKAVWNFAENIILSSSTQFVVKVTGLSSFSSGPSGSISFPIQFRFKLSAMTMSATPSRSIRVNGRSVSSFIDVPLEYVYFLTAYASAHSSYATLLESLRAQIEFLENTLYQLTKGR